MNSNFEYYKVFYFVSKYRNLTRAARALRTSQPAVTRTIRNLENDLGCRLFIRSKTGMSHTPEGDALFKYVAEGCSQFFRGETILGNMVSLEKGSIYISATETVLHCGLFNAMEEFKEKYPGVHFKILNNSSGDSVRMLKEGRVDMAIVSGSVETESPLRRYILREYRDILIGGTEFLLPYTGKVSLGELADCPWVSLVKGSFTRKFIEEYFSSWGLLFKPDIEVDTTDMIVMAVKHNMGIGFIPPEFARDAIRKGELSEIEIEEPVPCREIALIYDTEAPQSEAAKEFRRFLKGYKDIVEQRKNGFRVY